MGIGAQVVSVAKLLSVKRNSSQPNSASSILKWTQMKAMFNGCHGGDDHPQLHRREIHPAISMPFQASENRS